MADALPAFALGRLALVDRLVTSLVAGELVLPLTPDLLREVRAGCIAPRSPGSRRTPGVASVPDEFEQTFEFLRHALPIPVTGVAAPVNPLAVK